MSLFLYTGLEAFLAHLKTLAPVLPLCEWKGQRAIVLRHDVDLDIEAACKVAQIERKLGLHSSFFIMVSGAGYNPGSPTNRIRLQWLVQNDFEVGLHFDPTVYDSSSADHLQNCAEMEAAFLAGIVGQPIRSISLHNPSAHGEYPSFEGFNNAYDADIFRDDRYLSDSCMSFRGKDPYEFVHRAREHTIQILLHPIHFSQSDEGYHSILVRYLHGVKDSLEGYFLDVNDSFADAFPNGLASAFCCVGEQSNESLRAEHTSGGARYDSCNRQEC